MIVFISESYSGTAEELQKEFIFVSEAAGQAVVTVNATKTLVQKYGFRDLPFRDPFFDEFFKDFFGPMPEQKERQYRMQGLGSGFIIDKSGYILTNDHVVEDADEIEVTLPDGRRYPATVIGQDKRSDVAVLKIEGEDLPMLAMGNSDQLRTGQWVIAVGNPFGNVVNNPDPTITVGVVSALHRSLDVGEQDGRFYGNLIQTDAAINRGNSGGPLLNLKGEVVGINTLIFSTTGGNQGIGFAIPINHAKRVYENIIGGKEITYPWLGIWIQPLNRDINKQFGLETEGLGALIFKIQEGSPAEKAGIQVGDVVLKIADKDIRNPHDLVNIVSGLEVGQKVKVNIIREGETLEIEVEIGARPSEFIVAKRTLEKKAKPQEKDSWRGIKVRDITDEDRTRLKDKEIKGVIVDSVEPYSPAHFSGIRKGSLIDEVNRVPVASAEEFYQIASELKGKILVHTDGGYFVIDEEKEKESGEDESR